MAEPSEQQGNNSDESSGMSISKMFNFAGIGIFLGTIFLVVGLFFVFFPKLFSREMVCVPQECHGLEFTCGYKQVKQCDASYMFGDRCRKYAKCTTESGKCAAVFSEKFYVCRDCVKACKKKYIEDPVAYSNCEASCDLGKGFS